VTSDEYRAAVAEAPRNAARDKPAGAGSSLCFDWRDKMARQAQTDTDDGGQKAFILDFGLKWNGIFYHENTKQRRHEKIGSI
jgi:hypothetical protein